MRERKEEKRREEKKVDGWDRYTPDAEVSKLRKRKTSGPSSGADF